MMNITIQNCSKVTVVGTHTGRACKAVYNMTTGEIYSSVTDAANALGVSNGAVSVAIDGNKKRTCKGMRLCFLNKMTENLEEITEYNRIRYAKAKAYDEQTPRCDEIRKTREIIAKRNDKIAQNQERIDKYQSKIAELQAQIEKETVLLNEAKAKLEQLYEEI